MPIWKNLEKLGIGLFFFFFTYSDLKNTMRSISLLKKYPRNSSQLKVSKTFLKNSSFYVYFIEIGMVSNICCSGDSILLLIFFFFFFATKLQWNQKGWIFLSFSVWGFAATIKVLSIFRLFTGLCEESHHRVWSCASGPTALSSVLVSTHCPAGTTLLSEPRVILDFCISHPKQILWWPE